MRQILLIGLGGFIGSIARYGLAGFFQRTLGEGRIFPVGTMAVNILGCLLIGFLSQFFQERLWIRPEIRMALTVGVLGGFTTFSTFGFETYRLLTDGEWKEAALNVMLSVLLCLFAVWLGDRLAKGLLG